MVAASAAAVAAAGDPGVTLAGDPRVSLPLDLGRRALEVAPRLLGCVLRVGGVAVRITEVEAYEGTDDPASHAFRGPTPRNAVMFGPPGRLYVYRLHGHHCCNIVCGPEGVASAVLVRAGEVVDGLAESRARRPGVRDAWLARGPGNLTRALGITSAHNGADLAGPVVFLASGDAVLPFVTGPRVNVSRAHDRPWRFWLCGNTSVSAHKTHPGARGEASGGDHGLSQQG